MIIQRSKTFVTYISKCRYFQQEIYFAVSQSRVQLMKTIQRMNTSRHDNVADSAPNPEQHTSISSNLLNQTKGIQDIE